ncbi:MAG: HAMP domain-containing sensor histidine kinase, partial [Pseudomonadota bacterium]
AKGIESTIKLYIDDQMMPYVDWVNQHASQFEEMRMWTFNRIELDLVTVFARDGTRIFPESDQSALVNEISLLSQIQGEISTVISEQGETASFDFFIQGKSDIKLLHCDVQLTLTVCMLFNRNGWLTWLNQAMATIDMPAGLNADIKLYDANGLPLQLDSELEEGVDAKDDAVFEFAMGGNFSQWHIHLYEDVNATTQNLPVAYITLLLPLILLVLGSGAGLYWIYRARARQTQAQKTFTAELAHEVRTPLANIRLYIDLIKRLSSSKQHHYCSVVESEIERLSLLVENSILLAKLDANQHHSNADHRQSFNPDVLIKSILMTMAPVFEENKCSIKDALEVKTQLLLDKDALQRVMINLLDNARKYAQGKSIRVRSCIQDNKLCIDVIDDGPGLSKQIWQALYTNDFSLMTCNGTGFGLGLQVCMRLCQRMKGKLERLPVSIGTHLRVVVPIEMS